MVLVNLFVTVLNELLKRKSFSELGIKIAGHLYNDFRLNEFRWNVVLKKKPVTYTVKTFRGPSF